MNNEKDGKVSWRGRDVGVDVCVCERVREGGRLGGWVWEWEGAWWV